MPRAGSRGVDELEVVVVALQQVAGLDDGVELGFLFRGDLFAQREEYLQPQGIGSLAPLGYASGVDEIAREVAACGKICFGGLQLCEYGFEYLLLCIVFRGYVSLFALPGLGVRDVTGAHCQDIGIVCFQESGQPSVGGLVFRTLGVFDHLVVVGPQRVGIETASPYAVVLGVHCPLREVGNIFRQGAVADVGFCVAATFESAQLYPGCQHGGSRFRRAVGVRVVFVEFGARGEYRRYEKCRIYDLFHRQSSDCPVITDTMNICTYSSGSTEPKK